MMCFVEIIHDEMLYHLSKCGKFHVFKFEKRNGVVNCLEIDMNVDHVISLIVKIDKYKNLQ